MGTIVSSQRKQIHTSDERQSSDNLHHSNKGYYDILRGSKSTKKGKSNGTIFKSQKRKPPIEKTEQNDGLLYRDVNNTTALVPINEHPSIDEDHAIVDVSEGSCFAPIFTRPRKVRLKIKAGLGRRAPKFRRARFPEDKENKTSGKYETLEIESSSGSKRPQSSATGDFSAMSSSGQSKSSITVNPLFENSSKTRFVRIKSAVRNSDSINVEPYSQGKTTAPNKYSALKNHSQFTYYVLSDTVPEPSGYRSSIGNASSEDSIAFTDAKSWLSLDHLTPSEHEHLRKELRALRASGQLLDPDIGDGLLLSELAKKHAETTERMGRYRPPSTSTDGRRDLSSAGGYESHRSYSPLTIASSASAYNRRHHHPPSPDTDMTNMSGSPEPRFSRFAHQPYKGALNKDSFNPHAIPHDTNLLNNDSEVTDVNYFGRGIVTTEESNDDDLEVDARQAGPFPLELNESSIVNVPVQGLDRESNRVTTGDPRGTQELGPSHNSAFQQPLSNGDPQKYNVNDKTTGRGSKGRHVDSKEVPVNGTKVGGSGKKGGTNASNTTMATGTTKSADKQKATVNSTTSRNMKVPNGEAGSEQKQGIDGLYGDMNVLEKKPPHGHRHNYSKQEHSRPDLTEDKKAAALINGQKDEYPDIANETTSTTLQPASRRVSVTSMATVNSRYIDTDTSDSDVLSFRRRRSYHSRRRPKDRRSEASSTLRPTSATTVASDMSDHTTIYDVLVSSFTKVIITYISKVSSNNIKRMLWILRRERSRAVTSMYADLGMLAHDLIEKFTEVILDSEESDEDYHYDDRDTDYVKQLDREFLAGINDMRRKDEVTPSAVRHLIHAYQRRLDFYRTRRIRRVVNERETKKKRDEEIGIQEETAQLLIDLEDATKKTKEIRAQEKAHFNMKLLEKIAKTGKGKGNKKQSKKAQNEEQKLHKLPDNISKATSLADAKQLLKSNFI